MQDGAGMTDDEVIAKILDGYSLRTSMVPDPAIPTNRPEHVESYDLPHVIIDGDRFWGKSETAHLFHTHGDAGRNFIPGDPQSGLAAFCYSNAGGLFFSYTPDQGRLSTIKKSRYKKHAWALCHNYTLVWDSENGEAAKAVGKEIESAAKLKIAVLDGEDIWNVHPVDLPMYEMGADRFQLKTAADMYPKTFRDRAYLDLVTGHAKAAMEDAPQGDIETIAHLKVEGFSSFYSVFSDGTYYNFYDIARSTRQKYKRLKVFSDSAS